MSQSPPLTSLDSLSYLRCPLSYGLSSGLPGVKDTLADAEAAYDYLLRTYAAESRRVILYGQSLGSGPTLHLSLLRRANGVVVHAGFMSALRVLQPSLPSTPWMDIFANVDLVRRTPAPVFIIHGTEDAEIPVEHGRGLYEAAYSTYTPWSEAVDGEQWSPRDSGLEPLDCECIVVIRSLACLSSSLPSLPSPFDCRFVEGAGHNNIEVEFRDSYMSRLDAFVRWVESATPTLDLIEHPTKLKLTPRGEKSSAAHAASSSSSSSPASAPMRMQMIDGPNAAAAHAAANRRSTAPAGPAVPLAASAESSSAPSSASSSPLQPTRGGGHAAPATNGVQASGASRPQPAAGSSFHRI